MEFPLSIIRYANFINIYNQKTKLAIRIDRLIKELGFYGSEKSGEKNLLVSLGQLLEEAKIWIEQVHTIASEDEVEAVLAKLQDCLNDIDWEIAEEIEQILKQEHQEALKNLIKLFEIIDQDIIQDIEKTLRIDDWGNLDGLNFSLPQVDLLEKVYSRIHEELETVKREEGVILARESIHIVCTLENLGKIRQTLNSKEYRKLPSICKIALEQLQKSQDQLGAPLSGEKDLEVCLKSIGEKINVKRPFTTHADLLIINSQLKEKSSNPAISSEPVNYNIMLRTPSRLGVPGVSIQRSDQIEQADRNDMLEAISQLNQAFSRRSRDIAAQAPKTVIPTNQNLYEILRKLGESIYRLVIPSELRQYIESNPCCITISTNDLELPWELMYLEKEDNFLCLERPVARMPTGYAIPKKVKPRPSKPEKRFMLISADPMGDLQSVEKEIEIIETALKQKNGVSVETIKNITRKKFKELLLDCHNYDVIHYAGHAHFDSINPEQSSLFLCHEKGVEPNSQNLLSSKNCLDLMKGQPLIFLNACQTAGVAPEPIPTPKLEDDYVFYSPAEGLASAFIYGGALGCVGSLWRIYDQKAAEFAIHFYEYIINGETIGDAMCQARKDLRQAHPEDLTWAAFILYGHPTFRLV
jgi:hypothetical protein